MRVAAVLLCLLTLAASAGLIVLKLSPPPCGQRGCECGCRTPNEPCRCAE